MKVADPGWECRTLAWTRDRWLCARHAPEGGLFALRSYGGSWSVEWMSGPKTSAMDLAVRDDGSVAVAYQNGEVWAGADPGRLALVGAHVSGRTGAGARALAANAVAWLGDDVLSTGDDMRIRQWSPQGPGPVASLGDSIYVLRAAAFGLFTVGSTGIAPVGSTASLPKPPSEVPVTDAVPLADGSWIAIAGADDGRVVRVGPTGLVETLLASRPEVRKHLLLLDVEGLPLLVLGGAQGGLEVFDPGRVTTLAEIHAHDAEVTALAAGPEAGTFGSASKDGTVSFWRIESRAHAVVPVPGCLGGDFALKDGHVDGTIDSCGTYRSLRADASTPSGPTSRALTGPPRALGFVPGTAMWWATTSAGGIWRGMGSNGDEIRSAGALPGDPLAVIPGASGAMIGTLEGEVLLLNAGGDFLDKTVFDPERGSSSGVATGLARGEQWLLCGGRGAVRLLGVQKAKFDDVASTRMSHDDGACGSVTWPEAHRIVIGTALGRLVELDVPSLAVRRSVVVREGEWLVAAAASSRLLAFGTDSGRIVVVNSSSLDLIADWRGHGARISALAFDESEGRLWSTAWDGSVSWWDVAELGQ